MGDRKQDGLAGVPTPEGPPQYGEPRPGSATAPAPDPLLGSVAIRFDPSHEPVGLLFSGGLDSTILLGQLLARGQRVRPFYVRCGFVWEGAELRAAMEVLARFGSALLEPLVELQLPVGDVYGQHWSITGQGVPDETTPDEAVYLPGRNLLLIAKVALWCQRGHIHRLLLATLGSNPFPDGNLHALSLVEQALAVTMAADLRIELPLAEMDKRAAMRLGAGLPLGESFSCIRPRGLMHCGRCNKCAERRGAFAKTGLPDPTCYLE